MGKRGRRRNPLSKRNLSTRAGRRSGEIDQGTDELRALRTAITGRADLPLDPLGVLLGRDRISIAQYHAGRDIGDLLELIRPQGGSGGIWAAILAGVAISGEPGERPGAERAWKLLSRIRGRLGIVPAHVVFAVCSGEWRRFVRRLVHQMPWDATDATELAVLIDGLDAVAIMWARERRHGDEQQRTPPVV